MPLDSDFKVKHSREKGKGAVIKSEYLGCVKTSGIRMGAMDYGGSMTINFGSIPPGKEYDFPIFGFTFVYENKFLIAVLDLHPISKDKEYMENGKYLPDIEKAFRDYLHVFCDCIKKAEPISDQEIITIREKYMED